MSQATIPFPSNESLVPRLTELAGTGKTLFQITWKEQCETFFVEEETKQAFAIARDAFEALAALENIFVDGMKPIDKFSGDKDQIICKAPFHHHEGIQAHGLAINPSHPEDLVRSLQLAPIPAGALVGKTTAQIEEMILGMARKTVEAALIPQACSKELVSAESFRNTIQLSPKCPPPYLAGPLFTTQPAEGRDVIEPFDGRFP